MRRRDIEEDTKAAARRARSFAPRRRRRNKGNLWYQKRCRLNWPTRVRRNEEEWSATSAISQEIRKKAERRKMGMPARKEASFIRV